MLKWQSDEPPLPNHVVSGAELILAVKLPDAYRALVQQWPCGRPDRPDFRVHQPGRRGTWTSCVGVLLSLDPRHSENVFDHIKNLAVDEQLPAGLLPIADDGGGDLICLDYRRDPGEPAVVYWAHELGGEDAIVPSAASFTGFLELLDREGMNPDLDDERGS